MSATTFTIDSCPWAYHPMKSNVNARKAGRNHRSRRERETRLDWLASTQVRPASDSRRMAISIFRAFHVATQVF